MADLSILDLSLAKLQAETIDPADAPALIEAEKAGKTRKGAISFLETLLAPPAEREIECITHNVHLGDGRQLHKGERASCPADVAALIVGNEQAVYV